MKTVLLLLSAGALFLAGQTPAASPASPGYKALVQEAKAHIRHIDVDQFRALRSSRPEALLIDVRETEEWAAGHATGALHISKGMLEHDIEGKVPAKDAVLVLYCHSGSRSALAAENLMRMGYTGVYSLDGGFAAWQAAGLPVEK